MFSRDQLLLYFLLLLSYLGVYFSTRANCEREQTIKPSYNIMPFTLPREQKREWERRFKQGPVEI